MNWITREELLNAITALQRLEQELTGGNQAEVQSMRLRLESMLNQSDD